MKEWQGSRIQIIQREEEIGKCDLLRNIRATGEEIISLMERRPPPTERDTEDHQQNKRSDCEASTQTPYYNKWPENRTYGGAAEKEKEEIKSKTAALEKFLKENDCHIQKLNAIIQEIKERQGSRVQFIPREEEIGKCDLLHKIRAMREEIISLKERRTSLTERDTKDHKKGILLRVLLPSPLLDAWGKAVPHFPLKPHFLSRWVKTTLTCYISPVIFTYIYKKLHFWKRRRNDAVTNSKIATTMYNFISETGTQV
jgi:hypothetical protein